MNITNKDIQVMFGTYCTYPKTCMYNYTPLTDDDILRKCEMLFRKDYELRILRNTDGDLIKSYPRTIFLLEKEINSSSNVQENTKYNVSNIIKTMKRSRISRIEDRVPMPVILYRGKSICRSSTISDWTEAGEIPNKRESTERVKKDIELLNLFSVGAICDFLLIKKDYGYSSEEVELEHYENFDILHLPYANRGFFKKYKNDNYSGKQFIFKWNMPDVTRFFLPMKMFKILNPRLQVHKYKSWNMTTLTLTYVKIILVYIREAKHGILLHSHEGLDRIPLFTSLVRLSLWADGEIHKSLTPLEILYLTIAYDWLLFGHPLTKRIEHQEEIFFFCFNILEYLASEEYSIIKDQSNQPARTTLNPCIINVKKTPPHKHDYLPIASTSGQQTTSQQVAVDDSTLETCELMSLRKQKLKFVQINFYKMYINVLKTIYAPPSTMGLANDSYKYCVSKIISAEESPNSGSQLKKCNE